MVRLRHCDLRRDEFRLLVVERVESKAASQMRFPTIEAARKRRALEK